MDESARIALLNFDMLGRRFAIRPSVQMGIVDPLLAYEVDVAVAQIAEKETYREIRRMKNGLLKGLATIIHKFTG